MRVDWILTLLFLSLGFFLTTPILAQDSPSPSNGSAEGDEASEPLNDIKLLAQQAALPSLKGENKFILRESWWSGRIAPGKAKLIQVQLFRRNSYQFWLAVPNPKAELNLNIYDSEGSLIPAETKKLEGEHIISVVLKPELTGVYYIRVSLKTTINQEQDWAVIYAYR